MSISGNMFSGITIKVCIPYADINDWKTPTTSTPTGALSMIGNTSLSTAFSTLDGIGMTCLHPIYANAVSNCSLTTTDKTQAMVRPMSLTLPDIALAFTEYRVKSLTFHHEPAGNVSQSRNFVFAFSSDPASQTTGLRSVFSNAEGQVLSDSPVALANPSRAFLEQSTNSIIFPVWQGWSLDCPVTSDWRPVWTPAVYTFLTQYHYYNVATLRDCQFGSISCYNLTGNGGGLQGRLWMEAEFDFRDPTPVSGSPQLQLSSRDMPSPIRPQDRDRESKEQKRSEGKTEEKPRPSLTIEEVKHMLRTTDDVFPTSVRTSAVVETKTNGTTLLSVNSDDDDPEIVSPPRFGTPVTVPGSSDYTPRSTPETQRSATKSGISALKKK
jgi:hypothetical protein